MSKITNLTNNWVYILVVSGFPWERESCC